MKARNLSILFIAIAIVIAGGILIVRASRDNEEPCSMPDFTAYNGYPEDLLILKGTCVVPTAMAAISNRELPDRRHVIAFLGHSRQKEALPILTGIELDETEVSADRGSALLAVYRINSEEGHRLAELSQGASGELREVSRDILENSPYINERRTDFQAWRNYISETYAW